MPRVSTLITLVLLTLTACAAPTTESRASVSPSSPTARSPLASTDAVASPSVGADAAAATKPAAATPQSTVAPDGYREITLDLGRGIVREGRIYGDGSAGVVLTHMSRATDSQEDWAAFAEELADRGYRALTFNHDAQFVWRQVLAAADLLRSEGAETIVAVGASHGAMASLRAAQEPGNGLAGVVWLAGVTSGSGYAFREDDVRSVPCRLLFVSGTGDEYGAAEDAEELAGWAPNAELQVVDSDLHGTDILLEGGPAADALRTAMLEFVDRVATEPGEPCG